MSQNITVGAFIEYVCIVLREEECTTKNNSIYIVVHLYSCALFTCFYNRKKFIFIFTTISKISDTTP